MSRRLFDALPELGDRIDRADHVLLCLDFDGTLTRIVADPSRALLSPRDKQLLESLSHTDKFSTAIISGRERSDLQARVEVPGVIYAGNHGLDISGPGFIFVEPNSVAHRTALAQMAAELRRRLHGLAGTRVEDKGLTIAVHYRQAAPESVDQIREIVKAVIGEQPFRVTPGDKVYDIRPLVHWNKGTAVRWIQEKVEQPHALVVYVGDDTTDEDAFRTLAEGITIKVGNPEGTAAQYYLNGPAEVQQLLEWLLAHGRN
jgi:trehalose-phosphatase